MEKVYIVSRYSAKTKRERRFNEEVTKYFCRRLMMEGKRPVAPHLFYPQFCDDKNPWERQIGLAYAQSDLDDCDGFLIVIIDGVISDGMRGEIEYLAQENGRQGHIINMTRKEAEELIGGGADEAGRKYRSDRRLSGRIFQLHKKAYNNR